MQAFDASIKPCRIAARKIASGRADVGHEERVSNKNAQPLYAVSHIGRRMAGHMQGSGLHVADPEGLAIREQVIELRPVCPEIFFQIEDALEYFLYSSDVLAYGQPSPQCVLDIGGR